MGNNYTKLIGSGINASYQQQTEINSEYVPDKTITFKIGRNGVGGMNFNFTAPVSLAQQNLDLGFALPAFAVIKSCSIKCTIALVGIADMNMVLGNVSAGAQFIASASVNALNETISQNASLPAAVIDASKIWLGATPVTNTWDLATAGEWLVTIVYEDFGKSF
jgi:hypothetical protein